MTTRWLLDTSALLALRDDEDGAERVAPLLQAAQGGESRCLVCFMSRMELLDRVWKDQGERQARLADAQLQSLPITDHMGALHGGAPGAGRRHQGLPSPLAG